MSKEAIEQAIGKAKAGEDRKRVLHNTFLLGLPFQDINFVR